MVRFAATADAYDRFMGRYSVHLAPSFATLPTSHLANAYSTSAAALVR